MMINHTTRHGARRPAALSRCAAVSRHAHARAPAALRLTSQLSDGDTQANVAAARQRFAFLVVAPLITEWADGWLVSRDLRFPAAPETHLRMTPGWVFCCADPPLESCSVATPLRHNR